MLFTHNLLRRNKCQCMLLSQWMPTARAGALHVTGRQPWGSWASTILAHQLPRAVGSASSLSAVPATAVSQACVGPYRQRCGCLVHQLVGRSTITSQLKPLRAVHIPGELNCTADAPSRQFTFPREW